MSQPDEIRTLYARMIAGWNAADAEAMTADFGDRILMIGFDGSEVIGRAGAREHLSRIFADHKVASFVTIVREVRELAQDVALLRADVGMIPPSQTEVHPDRNAVQTMVAVRRAGAWKIELFQNTPAAWHGRDEDRRALTAELQAAELQAATKA
jgi:uncharacterized protein (TIGR02246 family)